MLTNDMQFLPILRGVQLPDGMPPSQTNPLERKLLIYLASEQFSGDGHIADVGCGSGGSTKAICLGIDANHRIMETAGIVHAYDYFRLGPKMYSSPEFFSLKKNPKPGDSYLPDFNYHLGEHLDYCVVHEGDICNDSGNPEKIEILFVDIAKSLDTFKCVVKNFYNKLIPQTGILLHQDFSRPRLPWLHYSTGYLLPYFDIIDRPVASTLVQRLTQKIPEEALQRLINDDFTVEEKIAYIDALRAHIDRDISGNFPYHTLFDFSIAYVYYWAGAYDEAERLSAPLRDNEFLNRCCQFMFNEIKSRGKMFS